MTTSGTGGIIAAPDAAMMAVGYGLVMTTLFGIDVSAHQGRIDWPRVASSVGCGTMPR